MFYCQNITTNESPDWGILKPCFGREDYPTKNKKSKTASTDLNNLAMVRTTIKYLLHHSSRRRNSIMYCGGIRTGLTAIHKIH